MRRLQSLAGPWVAIFGSQPAGRNLRSAASGTTKSSCIRNSALCSTKVSARACGRLRPRTSEAANCKCSLSTRSSHRLRRTVAAASGSYIPACGLPCRLPSWSDPCARPDCSSLPRPAVAPGAWLKYHCRRIKYHCSRLRPRAYDACGQMQPGGRCISAQTESRMPFLAWPSARAARRMRCGTAARCGRSSLSSFVVIERDRGTACGRRDDHPGAHLHAGRDRRLDGAGRSSW